MRKGPRLSPGPLSDCRLPTFDSLSTSRPCRRPAAPAGAGFSSFFSTTTHSVVRSRPAIDAAFCSAVRVTLVGSMTPALTRSSYASVSGVVAEVLVLRLLAPSRRRSSPRRPRSGRSSGSAPRWRGGRCRRRSARPRQALEPCRARVCARSSATPPPGHDALFDRGAGRVQRVLDPGLLLLHLGLGRGADVDHRHAAGELRQPLLELLLVVVATWSSRSRPDLVDAALDVVLPCPCRR